MNPQVNTLEVPLLPKANAEMPEYEAFKATLKYAAAILILPILSFFVSKVFIFDGIYPQNLITSNICSAVVAVLILHVTLGMYIYKAYSGSEKVVKKD